MKKQQLHQLLSYGYVVAACILIILYGVSQYQHKKTPSILKMEKTPILIDTTGTENIWEGTEFM